MQKVSSKMEKITSFHVMEVMSRAKALESQGRNIIHMEVGEPDFTTPQPIIDQGVRFLQTGEVHYTEAQGLLILRKKIAAYYLKQYQVVVPPERIFITPGASGALTIALAAVLEHGDEVLMADPGYPCNSNLTALFGGCPKAINVSVEDDFQLTAERVLEHWGTRTKGVMLASPSNPTGNIIPAKNLARLVKVIEQKSGFLISDEIYHGLVYDQPVVSALSFFDQAFVINSFSKFFGMTGWRLGWLIVPEYAINAANRLLQNLYISAPSHSQYAALAAFDEATQQVLLQRRDEFKHRRDVLYAGLIELGFVIPHKPHGAFYIYADCSNFTENSYAFALELLEKQGVAVTPGVDFGSNEPERYLRFAYTTSIDRIEEGLQRIKAFLQQP